MPQKSFITYLIFFFLKSKASKTPQKVLHNFRRKEGKFVKIV